MKNEIPHGVIRYSKNFQIGELVVIDFQMKINLILKINYYKEELL